VDDPAVAKVGEMRHGSGDPGGVVTCHRGQVRVGRTPVDEHHPNAFGVQPIEQGVL
jgi:hypothetical protein